MRVLTVVAVLAFVLAGCAGNPLLIGVLESSNALRVEPAQSPDHDYLISIRNVRTVQYNLDDKSIRERFALRYVQDQCPEAAIVGETVTEVGPVILGHTPRLYAVKVKCEGGKRA